MISGLGKAHRSKFPGREKLRQVIVFHLRCLLDEVEGSAAHLMTNGLHAHLHQRLVAKRDRYERGVRQLIEAGMCSGEFIRGDSALAARALLGALNWSAHWFNPEGPMTAAEIAEGFADYLIGGLLVKSESLRRPSAAKERKPSARGQLWQSNTRIAEAEPIARKNA